MAEKKTIGALKGVFLGIGAFIIISIIISIFTKPGEDSEPAAIKAKYTVTGTAKTVTVTYMIPDGMSQKSDVPIPWEYSFETERNDMLILSAQNQGNSGSVVVTLYVDYERIQQVASEGAFIIASTKGYMVR